MYYYFFYSCWLKVCQERVNLINSLELDKYKLANFIKIKISEVQKPWKLLPLSSVFIFLLGELRQVVFPERAAFLYLWNEQVDFHAVPFLPEVVLLYSWYLVFCKNKFKCGFEAFITAALKLQGELFTNILSISVRVYFVKFSNQSF